MNQSRKILGFFLTVMFFLASVPSLAAVQTRYESARGEGRSYSEATLNALSNASAQAFGINITEDLRVEVEVDDSTTDGTSKNLMAERLNRLIKKKINSPLNRPILGYSVEESSELSPGKWQVAIKISYAVYTSDGSISDKRRTVIVLPVRSSDSALAEHVMTALVGTRRFKVLERGLNRAFDGEETLIKSGRLGPEAVSRIGREQAADYIVVVDSLSHRVVQSSHEIAISSERFVTSTLVGAIRVRVFDSGSRELKWSRERAYSEDFDGSATPLANLNRKVHESVAKSLVSDLTDAIYPIRIVGLESLGGFYINRGESAVSAGEKFMVYQTSGKINDIQSGESLGEREIPVGEATVVSVFPKFSVLHMDDQTIGKPAINFIVRKVRPDAGGIHSKDGSPSFPRQESAERNDWLLAPKKNEVQ